MTGKKYLLWGFALHVIGGLLQSTNPVAGGVGVLLQIVGAGLLIGAALKGIQWMIKKISAKF